MTRTPGFNPGPNGITLDNTAPVEERDAQGNRLNLVTLRNTADGAAIDVGMWEFPAVDAVGSFQSDGAGNVTFGPVSGGGTVTSVGLALPSSELTVTVSPITTSGTLTAIWASQAAHKVFAAPSGGAGTPSFRLLVAGDLPGGTGSVTSVDVSGGTTGLTTSGGPITTAGTITIAGTLIVANGGTGVTTLTSHGVVVGQGTSAVHITAAGASNTVLHGNTGADPTYSAVDVAADVTGILPVANGGTGAATLTIHGVVIGQTTSAVHITAAGADHTFLRGNTSADPTFNAVDVSTADITGTLGAANGGTGLATLTAHDVLVGAGTSAVALISPSTAGKVLTSNGTGSDPSFQVVTTGRQDYGTIVQTGGSNATAGTSFTLTFGVAPTNGNTIIAQYASSNTGAEAFSQTNVTWTQITTAANGTTMRTSLWKGAVGASAGTTLTITRSGAGAMGASAREWSSAVSGTLVSQSSSTGTSTTIPVSQTPSSNSLVYFTGGYPNGGTAVSSIGPWTGDLGISNFMFAGFCNGPVLGLPILTMLFPQTATGAGVVQIALIS